MLSTKCVFKYIKYTGHIYLIYMYEEDLALNILQGFICHKTQPTMMGTAAEIRMNAWAMSSYGLLHMNWLELADKQGLIYISSMQTLEVVWRIFQEQWKIGTDGERKLRESVL